MAYTRRLGEARPDAPGSVLIHTAAVGVTTVIRDLIIAHFDQTPQELTFYKQAPGAPGYYIYAVAGAEPNVTYHLDLRQELLVGEHLYASAGASIWTALATGYLLVD
jgi:hypothetical protein